MASRSTHSNSLVSTRPPDQPLAIQLHPLVLLIISDYITRYTLRGLSGPLFGAVIGQQNGRSITLEHAYECTTQQTDDGFLFDQEFFTQRLEQYRAVHKAHGLDLQAIFMLSDVEGPQEQQVAPLLQVQKLAGNENVLLLLFHPSMVESLEGGKLPISIYEAFKEQDDQTKFWDRPFEVETGEAEMIGINYVAKSSGGTQAVSATSAAGEGSKEKTKGKGKAKEERNGEQSVPITNVLSPQDDELIAALTAKANAVKMLQQRLDLIKSYLASLASDESSAPPSANLALLRNIKAMISRLPLLTADENSSFAKASTKEDEDVQLTSLLSSLTRSVADAQMLGSRLAEVQRERMAKERTSGAPSRYGPVMHDGMLEGGP